MIGTSRLPIWHVIAQHYRIFGRVQGVFYRSSARDKALDLGLTGWVRNLADGSVEAYACGKAESVGKFETWLEIGPRHAEVREVVVSNAIVEALSDFEVR